MKKEKVPQGKNDLTKCIEQIMTDYGGHKYAKVDQKEFENDVSKRLLKVFETCSGPIKPYTISLIKKLKNKSVQDSLFILNESLFTFFEGEE